MGFERDRPYNDLPRLWPVTREFDTKAVLRAVVPARAALAELKATCRALPNSQVLLQTLGLEETRSSAAIENIVTTQDALFQGMADERTANAPTREVLAHQRALHHGFSHVKSNRPITVPLMEEVVGLITGNRAGVRRVPGTRLTDGDNPSTRLHPTRRGGVVAQSVERSHRLHEQRRGS
jgi:Fic family protein